MILNMLKLDQNNKFQKISRLSEKGTFRFFPPALFLTDLGCLFTDLAEIRTRSSLLQIMKGAAAGFTKNALYRGKSVARWSQ